jgi:hypothetical protein
VWEDGQYIGCVLFAHGANNHIGSPYGLTQTETAELVRIALRGHKAPVSRIAAIAIRFLRKQSPGLRLIVSYADPQQGHHGGIYQAGNWVYVGLGTANRHLLINGKAVHKRTVSSAYGTTEVSVLRDKFGLDATNTDPSRKHTYLMPLDDAIRTQITKLKKPYPTRVKTDAVSTPHQSADESDPLAPELMPHGRTQTQTDSPETA